MVEPRPIIVAGMHHSGSSRADRLLGALGLDLGNGRAATDSSDAAIHWLHRRVLEQACQPGEPGVRRWGWTVSEQLDASAVEAARDSAEAYAAGRRATADGAWGFAEPRATLLLDLWAQVLPDAVFVHPYRAPWDVVADVLAMRLPELEEHPDYAARVWLRYARAQIAFARRHPQRCALVHADAIYDAPHDFAATMAALIGEGLPSLADEAAVTRAAQAFADQRPARLDPEGPLAGVVRVTAHEVPAAYEELQRIAGLPARRSVVAAQAQPEAQAIGRLATFLAGIVSELRGAAPAELPSDLDPAHPMPAAAIGARTRSRLGRRRHARSAAGPPESDRPVLAELPSPADPAERWFREHYGEAADKTLAFLAAGGVSLEGKDIADIGSGDGIIDLALVHRGVPRRLVGYDLRCTNREHLAEQAARYGVLQDLPAELEFKTSQTTGLPAGDDEFDVVVTWSAFEHISDPVGVAKEIRRVLRPGGVLFLQLWPFYRSERGSHLWDWFPEPHHHLLEHEDGIVERMLASDVHEPGWTRYMADEFRRLNRLTVEELHRSLLAADLHVARLELMTSVVTIPSSLGRYPLNDLAVGGVQLLAV